MDLEKILHNARTVAVVGCSQRPQRASNRAFEMLSEAGYTVIPVNPKYRTIDGVDCLPDFADIPEEKRLDIVNIFRNSSATLDAVQAVIDRAERTGRKPVIWTQPGVSSEEAENAADRAGFTYVRDTCIMVELGRMRRR